MIIYKTINLINEKFYVGKDSKNDPSYLGSGILLQRAIKKHGIENFRKTTLEECKSEDELNKREIYWIQALSGITLGYNIASGGNGGDTYTNNPNYLKIIEKLSGSNNHFFNEKHNLSSKEKISKKLKGRNSWNKGKSNIYSDSTIKKMSESRKKRVGKNSSNYVNINEEDLIKILKTNTIKYTAKHFNVSITCIRSKIKEYNIFYENKRSGGSLKYNISFDMFQIIINDRRRNKLSLVELSKKHNIGVNKLRSEFKTRNININRIK